MPARIDVAIRIPDARTATAEEMRACGRALQQFVRDTEAQLPAMADSRAHDRVVDFLRGIAARYNAQVRIFRELAARRAERERRLWAVFLGSGITPAQRQTRH